MARYAIRYDHEHEYWPFEVMVKREVWWRDLLGLESWKRLKAFEELEKAKAWIASREAQPQWIEITPTDD